MFSIEFIERSRGDGRHIYLWSSAWCDCETTMTDSLPSEFRLRTSKRSCSRCKRAKYLSQPLHCCSKVLQRTKESASSSPPRPGKRVQSIKTKQSTDVSVGQIGFYPRLRERFNLRDCPLWLLTQLLAEHCSQPWTSLMGQLWNSRGGNVCRNFGANYVNTYQQMGEPTTHHTRHDVLALLSPYVGYNRHDCEYVIIILLEQLIEDGIKEELMNL